MLELSHHDTHAFIRAPVKPEPLDQRLREAIGHYREATEI